MTKLNLIKIPAWIAEELFESEGEVLTDPTDESSELWSFVATREGDSRRWNKWMDLILTRRSDGKFFAIGYQLGLTENQPHEFPWRPDWRETPENVEAREVRPETVTKIVYRDVRETLDA